MSTVAELRGVIMNRTGVRVQFADHDRTAGPVKHVLARRPEDRTAERAVPMASDDEKLRVLTPAEQYLTCTTGLDNLSHDHVGISLDPAGETFRQNCPFPSACPDPDRVVLGIVWKIRPPRMHRDQRRVELPGELEGVGHGGDAAPAAVHTDDDRASVGNRVLFGSPPPHHDRAR